MKNILLAIISMMVLNACSMNLTRSVKENSKWKLSSWPGRQMPSMGNATFNITDGRISGKSFCNSYGGQITFNGNAIQLSQLFNTKMYCDQLAESENNFMNDLLLVNAGSVHRGKLTLMKDERILMVFDRAE